MITLSASGSPEATPKRKGAFELSANILSGRVNAKEILLKPKINTIIKKRNFIKKQFYFKLIIQPEIQFAFDKC
jgi:hypothetical protein